MDLENIKDRKLVRWTIAYGVFALGALGFAGEVSEAWGWSDVALRRVQILLAGGFLPAIALAWFHGASGRQRVTQFEVATVGLAAFLATAAPFLIVRGSDAMAEAVDLVAPYGDRAQGLVAVVNALKR